MPHKIFKLSPVGCSTQGNLKVAQVFLWSLVLIMASACARLSEQPVSGPVTLGVEWTEITPPEPLKVKYNEQSIRLTLTGVADLQQNNTLVLDDDRKVVIDAELIDDQGTAYKLEIGSVAGTIYASYFRAGDYPPGPDYPIDRTFVKLRISSNLSINVDEIRWICATTP